MQRKLGSRISLTEMESDFDSCLPIHFVVSVSMQVSSWKQTDSISKLERFAILSNFCSYLKQS